MATTINIADGTDEEDAKRQERLIAAIERITDQMGTIGYQMGVIGERIDGRLSKIEGAIDSLREVLDRPLLPGEDLGRLGSLG